MPAHFSLTLSDSTPSVGITVTATDAENARRPPGSLPGRSNDKSINHYEDASEEAEVMWRRKLGDLIVKKLIRDDQAYSDLQNREHRLLTAFPLGYKLFTQNKDGRLDHYLYGSSTVKAFRSPAEFFLHILWLMDGKPMRDENHTTCECKYCDRTVTQSEISRRHGMGKQLYERHSTRASRSAGRQERKAQLASRTIIAQAKDYTKLNPSG